MGTPRKICNFGGCNQLAVAGQSYCQHHLQTKQGNVFEAGFKRNPEHVKFYAGHRWNKTRAAFRKAHPLCEECKAQGIITPAQMVHHDPELSELLAKGMNPYDWQYLHSLCNRCHLGHLRSKKKVVKETKSKISMGEGVPKSLKHLLLYR